MANLEMDGMRIASPSGDRPASPSSAGIATAGERGEVLCPRQGCDEDSPSFSSPPTSRSNPGSPSLSRDSIGGPSSEELLRFREELRQIREERRAAETAPACSNGQGALTTSPSFFHRRIHPASGRMAGCQCDGIGGAVREGSFDPGSISGDREEGIHLFPFSFLGCSCEEQHCCIAGWQTSA